MLARGQEMNGFTNPVRVDWEDKEWTLVAEELQRQHPTKHNLAYYRFSYTTVEIEDAAEAVLPQHRHRAIDSFDAIKRPLFDAFQRMIPSKKPVLTVIPESVRSDGHIVWKPEEWEAVAYEIFASAPKAFDNGGATINIKLVNEAQLILAVNRRRNFKQVVGFRAQIMKTWEHMKAAKLNEPEPVIVDFPSGPVMEPPKQRQDDNSAIATAMHEAFQASPIAEKKRKQRVDWTAQEWLDVAREMRRQNPHINFFSSKFVKIDLPAIRDAQREVLTLDRRRNLNVTKGLQQPLVDAFAALLKEVNEENYKPDTVEKAVEITVQTVAEAEQEEAKPTQDQHAQPAVDSQLSHHPLPVSAIETVPLGMALPSTQENTFQSALLNAAAPLANFLVSELVKQLAPAVVQMMLPELIKSLSEAMPKATAIHSPLTVYSSLQTPSVASVLATVQEVEKVPEVAPKRPTAAEIAAFNGVTVAKAKKQKIVLLGPMGKQKSDIEQAYPDYNFVFIEHGHGIKEAAVDCELFIVYTSHYNAANKASVKKYVPFEKVRQVAGSLSSVKNQIQVWEASEKVSKH